MAPPSPPTNSVSLAEVACGPSGTLRSRQMRSGASGPNWIGNGKIASRDLAVTITLL
jgi:hypothetical protein